MQPVSRRLSMEDGGDESTGAPDSVLRRQQEALSDAQDALRRLTAKVAANAGGGGGGGDGAGASSAGTTTSTTTTSASDTAQAQQEIQTAIGEVVAVLNTLPAKLSSHVKTTSTAATSSSLASAGSVRTQAELQSDLRALEDAIAAMQLELGETARLRRRAAQLEERLKETQETAVRAAEKAERTEQQLAASKQTMQKMLASLASPVGIAASTGVSPETRLGGSATTTTMMSTTATATTSGSSAAASAGAGSGASSIITKLPAEQFERLLNMAERHPCMSYPGYLKQQFLDMLVHRVFVVMSGSVEFPYDGHMWNRSKDVGSGPKLHDTDRQTLQAFNLLPLLFNERRNVVTADQWRQVLDSKFGGRLLVATLMIAFQSRVGMSDLAVNQTFFREMKSQRMPLAVLYKALFFHLSDGLSILTMKVLRKQQAWAVLSMYNRFGAHQPLDSGMALPEWEEFLSDHLDKWSPDAHKLLLSSIIKLSKLSLDQIKSTKNRECLTLECSVM